MVFSIFALSHVARQQPLLHLHDDLIHMIAEEESTVILLVHLSQREFDQKPSQWQKPALAKECISLMPQRFGVYGI